ncbi:hypothetical protein [Streptococcus oricebi]|uniref:Uncharacterized protein n=1 Tax=Streptococcus oricebi TaxID=1547447 RepID=A0ABS5B5Y2_9STRE|nr:hypothetical protein [Streptococcus oricebi]MBP2623891.1 hypothetical protein [Streptococcus oricebi]
MKNRTKHILLAACFLLLSLVFALFLVKNIPFQTWAFERHQNLLSWYIRPILIVPIIYFSYKRQLVGITASIFALFTSMIWFPVPSQTPTLVEEFLTYERQFLQATWSIKEYLFTFLVVSFFILIVRAAWLHSWKLVGLILIATAFLKMLWSYLDSGSAGLTIVLPASLGLIFCLLALAFLKRKK